MMSFWKSLFGGGAGGGGPAKVQRSLEYKGCLIEAQPYAEGGQYQVAGTISKTVDGARAEHRFVRADRFGSVDDAAEVAINKGRQLIDQQGDKVFEPRG